MLRNEKVKTYRYAEEESNEVVRQRSSHVNAAPLNEHLSGSNDVIHCFSLSLCKCVRFK